MERYAVVGILLIVVISAATVIYLDSSTGAYSSSYGYASKIYGGAIKKAIKENPSAFGKRHAQTMFIQSQQEYIYSNRDRWDCSFGDEALDSAYPCVFDEQLGKYCCVLPEAAT